MGGGDARHSLDRVCQDSGLKQACPGAWKPRKRICIEDGHMLGGGGEFGGGANKRREMEVGDTQDGKAVGPESLQVGQEASRAAICQAVSSL